MKKYHPVFATVIFAIITIAMTFLLALNNDAWVKVAASSVQILLILCISMMALMCDVKKRPKLPAKTKKGRK
ncbi:hypothetical protein FWC31_02630 [Candidatus Saccharibacteria bacterium]|nr:hypothetical protein [Candidatus Saccharibacteria bacterium]